MRMRSIALLFYTGILLRTSTTDAALDAISMREHSQTSCELATRRNLAFLCPTVMRASVRHALDTTPYPRLSAQHGRRTHLAFDHLLRPERSGAARAAGVKMAASAGGRIATGRGLALEEAMKGRILTILRIPPSTVQIANVEDRISPTGLARQEFREEAEIRQSYLFIAW
jgi:hypothetical protein